MQNTAITCNINILVQTNPERWGEETQQPTGII